MWVKMEYRKVYEEIQKQCKKSFIAGYDMYHTIALVYIWSKEDFFTGGFNNICWGIFKTY